MDGFQEREREEEAKFKHEMELAFKVRNRRNKLFGLWVAEELLGLAGEEALAYAKDVVMADFEGPGDDDMMEKVKRDLAAKGVEISEHRLRRRLAELEEVAREQVMNEA